MEATKTKDFSKAESPESYYRRPSDNLLSSHQSSISLGVGHRDIVLKAHTVEFSRDQSLLQKRWLDGLGGHISERTEACGNDCDIDELIPGASMEKSVHSTGLQAIVQCCFAYLPCLTTSPSEVRSLALFYPALVAGVIATRHVFDKNVFHSPGVLPRITLETLLGEASDRLKLRMTGESKHCGNSRKAHIDQGKSFHISL